jgi:hypothetical protein
MGANKPIEDIEATLLAATKSALRTTPTPRPGVPKTPRRWSPTREYNDAHEVGWWISKDVGEIQIQRHENPPLATANFDYTIVGLTTK